MSLSPPASRLPLSRFEQVHTLDVDEARTVVSRSFGPHQVTPLDDARQFDARFHSARIGQVGLSYLAYGSSVRVIPREQEGFYLVQIPLVGSAEVSCGRERIMSDTNVAAVSPPDQNYIVDVGAGHSHLVVWIARTRLEEHLRTMLDRPVGEPIRFNLGMDLRAPAARSWHKVVNLLLEEVDGDGLIPAQPLAMRELERLLLSQLLLAQPNNYSTLLHEEPRATAPKVIRYAAELIEAHAAEPLTVEDIAEATGVSVRALQEGFRRFLDTTPMNCLREVRLQRVREELTAADPTSATVTDIATRWGFLHAGRFSVQYRNRFGESPSVTLRY